MSFRFGVAAVGAAGGATLLVAGALRPSAPPLLPSEIDDVHSGVLKYAVRGSLRAADEVRSANRTTPLLGAGPFAFCGGRLHRSAAETKETVLEFLTSNDVSAEPDAEISATSATEDGVRRTCYGCGVAAAVAAPSWTVPRRALCRACAASAVTTTTQGDALLSTVVHDLHRFLGIDLRDFTFPLRLVDETDDEAWEGTCALLIGNCHQRALGRAASAVPRPPYALPPLTLSVVSPLFFLGTFRAGEDAGFGDPIDAQVQWRELPFVGAVSVRKFTLLSGLPQSHTGKMIAHELTHVFLHRGMRSHAPLPPRLEEGLCELVGYLWLSECAARLEFKLRTLEGAAHDGNRTERLNLSNRLRVARWRLLETERNPDLIYGGGLRDCLASLRGRPLRVLLEHVRRHKALPVPTIAKEEEEEEEEV
tara:strand:+ start:776 stop:2041 length:1266 start_codon:yes stop_codon:yes gene_type:complete